MANTDKNIDRAIKGQVYLERLKTSEVKRYEKFLSNVDSAVRDRLSRSDLTDFGRAKLNSEIVVVRDVLDGIYTKWQDQFVGELEGLAQYEAELENGNLDRLLDDLSAPDGVSFVLPSPEQLRSAVFTVPLSVKGPNGGNLLKPFIKDFTEVQKRQITGAIRQGYFQGATNAEILKNIRGTKAARFQDGILNVSRNHAMAIIRTSVQHTASVARQAVWDNNDDIVEGYRWNSTLDSRTTQVCRSLDGQVFKLGKGPVPPIHIGCRSRTVAELSDDLKWLQEGRTRSSEFGQVKDQTYYEWLKNQDAKFQNDALGPDRAKLFRDGGLSADEFAKLNLGRNFEPLTLEEMRNKNPTAFSRAKV